MSPKRLSTLDRQLLRDLRRVAKHPTPGREDGLRALRYRVLVPDDDENWDSDRVRTKGIRQTVARLTSLEGWYRLSSRAEMKDAGASEPWLTNEPLFALHVTPEAFVQRVTDLEDDLSGLFDVAPGGDASKGKRWRRDA